MTEVTGKETAIREATSVFRKAAEWTGTYSMLSVLSLCSFMFFSNALLDDRQATGIVLELDRKFDLPLSKARPDAKPLSPSIGGGIAMMISAFAAAGTAAMAVRRAGDLLEAKVVLDNAYRQP